MHVLLLDLGLELRGGQRQVYYLARALAETRTITALTACPADGALAAFLSAKVCRFCLSPDAIPPIRPCCGLWSAGCAT